MRSYSGTLALLSLLASTSASAQTPGSGARICLAPASAKTVGSANTTIDAVRESFTSFLTGPSLSVTPLAARLESQAREEARLGSCPYVLFTNVEHKRKSGSSILNRAAGTAVQQGAWQVGARTGSDVGRVAAGAVAGAAGAAVSDWAYSVKTKDELSLGYRLEAADGTVLVNENSKRKAESDGEDLLTPQVEQAAGKIADAVSRRTR
jgi:hypothetical protein